MYALKNHMEDCIQALVGQIMPEYDVCQCEKCRLDVMALVLNRLPSHYVVTPRGALFAQVDTTLPQNQTNALTAVIQAIMMVQKRPKHEPCGADGG